MTPDQSPLLACSVQTEALGENPAGTAPRDSKWLLVELSDPWPPAINQHPELGRASSGEAHLIGIRSPERVSLGDRREVIYYQRSEGAFASLERYSATVEVERLAELVEAVGAADLSLLQPDPGRDVVVCGHASRDQCCGLKGPELVAGLPPVSGGLWIGSHLGGHRFAPTMIDLPSGLCWAHLSPVVAAAALDRSLDPQRIRHHLRGCVAFDSPYAQAADAAAIARQGWAWVDAVRTAEAGQPDATGAVPVDLTSGSRAMQLLVRPGRTLPVPECMHSLDDATKSVTELIVD